MSINDQMPSSLARASNGAIIAQSLEALEEEAIFKVS